MKNDNTLRLSMSALAIATAMALPAAAQAQVYAPAPMSDAEVDALPAEYRSAPVTSDYTETSIDEYGVETVTRTRRIERPAAYPGAAPGHTATYAPTYQVAGHAPAGAVFERDQWLDECEERTNGRSNGEKGGIIGGLLGAVAGGIIGNRSFDSERLGGTLLGVGVGGLAGGLLGSLIGGGRDSRGDYDCEAALDGYLSQYGYPGAVPATRIATRSIPARAPAYAAPAYAAPVQYGYGYAPAYQSYGYTYQPPQQIVYVPVQYQQQQRVIVRETVREEVVSTGATRSIPQPAPAPRPIPAPPRYIKGN